MFLAGLHVAGAAPQVGHPVEDGFLERHHGRLLEKRQGDTGGLPRRQLEGPIGFDPVLVAVPEAYGARHAVDAHLVAAFEVGDQSSLRL